MTFYNDGYAIQTVAPAHADNPDNSYASVEVLAMNDIFDGSTNVAVNLQGQNAFSQLQYNLFYNNATNIVSTTNDGDFEGNQGASYGNPDFVGPVGAGLDATAENFELEPNSPAIDAGRSEIGPVAGGNAIYPGTTLTLVERAAHRHPDEPSRPAPGRGAGQVGPLRRVRWLLRQASTICCSTDPTTRARS